MEILYTDQDIAVVIKPRGVLSEEKAGEETVPALLAETVGKVYPVHRLDRAVGGVMVYARSRRAAAHLSAAIRAGGLKKVYTAVVTGIPVPAEGTWQDWLYHDARANKTFVADRVRNGVKEAVLRYRVTDQTAADGVEFSRISVELLTGRSHQIRAQFASRGFPLVGDGKYGSRVKAPFLSLAATALEFSHPKNGKKMHFSAPVPRDFPWNLFADSHFEIERKFLISYPDVQILTAFSGCRIQQIVQTYLPAPEGETRRVREIRESGSVRYVQTVKHCVSMMRAVEEEKELSQAAYEAALQKADPALHSIHKTRYSLPFGGHVIEVDLFDFWQDRAVLEVELGRENEQLELPPLFHVIREVTRDKRYKNFHLARTVPNDPLCK